VQPQARNLRYSIVEGCANDDTSTLCSGCRFQKVQAQAVERNQAIIALLMGQGPWCWELGIWVINRKDLKRFVREIPGTEKKKVGCWENVNGHPMARGLLLHSKPQDYHSLKDWEMHPVVL
jgi:hypothetical protein